jgi:hypothetical protein
MTASVSESGSGGVAAYDSGTAYSEYNSSGGRRRGKRSSRRNSRRRSRKMYRGGNEEQVGNTGNGADNGAGNGGTVVDPPVGGRRRRGKTQKGKTRKGKVSKWITHVKNFSKANKMDFRDALKDPKCKSTYHKMK